MSRFQNNKYKAQQGFTLLEMSAVLLIGAFVAGGIVLGQSLSHQARLTHVVTEFNAIRTSLNAFQAQYDAKPGDFRAASEYWPEGQWNTDWAKANNLGDGNGIWGNNRSAFYEGVWAWQQLARAEIIPGPFIDTPELSDSFTFVRPVEHLYPSKVKGAGYMLLGSQDWMGEEGIGNAIGNYILLADFSSAESWNNSNVVFSAEDAYFLDAKMDDGRALAGKFLSSGDCLDADDYDMQAEGRCVAMFSLDREFAATLTLAMNEAPSDDLPPEMLGALEPSAGMLEETPELEIVETPVEEETPHVQAQETPKPADVAAKEKPKCEPKKMAVKETPKPAPKKVVEYTPRKRKGGLCNHGRG